tara:strand:+ start:4425 stop:5444 length:1020 start_codon:yes stop_codon:yes gene_type:complete
MKKITIAVPPGIGDSLWSLTKISNIRKQKEIDCVELVVQNTDLNRSHDFLKSFTFVDSVRYADFVIHPLGIQYSKEGPYIYIESQEYWQPPERREIYDFLLISNGHLERGLRLEDWLPEFETDFSIGKQWQFNPSYLLEAQNFKKEKGQYAVLYLGPFNGNTKDGHNRGPIWSLRDWMILADSLHSNYGLHIVLVGAPYDKSYSDGFMMRMGDRDYITDLVGQTEIGLTYSYILYSEMCMGYQSGIPIFSVYLGVPAVCWWRPYKDSISPTVYISFDETMASAWAPPWSLENKRYAPQIYGKSNPQSIIDTVEERGWIGSRGEPEFDDNWCLTDVGENS